MVEVTRGSVRGRGRHSTSAGFVLITLLCVWRVLHWQGPWTTTFAANALLLWSAWSLWLLLLGLIESSSTRLTSRAPRVAAWGLLLLTVILPEMLWRAHAVGAQAGWGKFRMATDWLLTSLAWSLLLAAWLRWSSVRWFGRRAVLAVVAVGVVSLAVREWPAGRGSDSTDRPNVLLIVVDALRADALGCYGNPMAPTPHMDALAAKGWRFEHAYSTATTSVPGHTSILWGLDVYTHGALSNEYDVPSNLPASLAEELSQRGYRCFGVCQNPLVSASSGFGRGFEHYWSWFEPDMAHASASEILWQFAITRSWLQLAGVEPISARAKAQMKGRQPWMGFVQFLYAHDPYHDGDHWATPSHVDAVKRLLDKGRLLNRTTYSDREVAELIAKYDGAAHYVDRLIGQLVEVAQGLERETLIVITADHGENLAEHGDEAVAQHFGYYETSLRVPWIVSSTRRDLSATRSELTGVDRIAPTILAWVDSGPDSAATVTTKSMHLAYSRPLLVALDDSLKAVVDGSDLTSVPSIYRWRDDPLDQHPLDVSSALVDTLLERQEDIAPLLHDRTASMRPEKLQRLRALGYIE